VLLVTYKVLVVVFGSIFFCCGGKKDELGGVEEG